MKIRCPWVNQDHLMIEYHDNEWGVPVHDNHKLFEFLILEGAQAGLTWSTILKKRENYRNAFDNFDPEKIAKYGSTKIDEQLQNSGIVRNKLKINAAVTNANAYLDIQREYGSFNSYIWKFVGGKPVQNNWKKVDEVPVYSEEAVKMSVDLKKRGFKFVGPTICYAFMQAVGMVNDHVTECYRHSELNKD